MNARYSRQAPSRAAVAPLHRGPGAMAHHAAGVPVQHAPNAALLIDFDNVTMGIRSDLQTELRNLLSSDIIQGKVAVQRAYADWRRYPQYIVPLSESSIDLIFAPAYGSSKKNATDIRLAIDALELVFTRPEIGTFILLSGDSDFSSLVLKLKEYGKYVIGVGIRESSSDLLVQNCDEYYSYNALAGLVKASDEEMVKHDPWELVVEAIERMARNGDVMRSDRLKQVMQDIDASFDEKELGYSKFSRFCLEAAQRGLILVNRLENGQFEVAPASAVAAAAAPADAPASSAPAPRQRDRDDDEERSSRRRGRSRRGRGRQRDDREERDEQQSASTAPTPSTEPAVEAPAAPSAPQREEQPRAQQPVPQERPAARPEASQPEVVGRTGERLTRSEAFDLVRRAVESLVSGDQVTSTREVRMAAYRLLGRDSESLSERNFPRILKDAHDANMVDLRRRGDDYEVAVAASTAPITDQLNRASAATTPTGDPASSPTPRGMGHRGGGGRGMAPRGRSQTPPADLLSIGVVEAPSIPALHRSAPEATPAVGTEAASVKAPAAEAAAPARSTAKKATGRGRPARKAAAASKAAATGAPAAKETVAKAPVEKEPVASSTATKAARPARQPRKAVAKSTAVEPTAVEPTAAATKKASTSKAQKTSAAGKSASAPARKKTATKAAAKSATKSTAKSAAKSTRSGAGARKAAGGAPAADEGGKA